MSGQQDQTPDRQSEEREPAPSPAAAGEQKGARDRRLKDNDNDGSDDERKPVSSKATRLLRCILAVACASFLAWCAYSSEWHSFVVQARPRDVNEMFQALMAIVPNGKAPAVDSQILRSEELRPVFRLRAGLWTSSVVGLCSPQDVFSKLVDKPKCEEKLTNFCNAKLTINVPSSGQKTMYEKCKGHVDKGGFAMSLLFDLPTQAAPEIEKNNYGEEDLESTLAVHDDDNDEDFCETVADCDLLREMLPYSRLLALLFCSACTMMTVSSLAFIGSVASDDPKWPTRGCHAMFATALVLIGALAVDIYRGESFPLEKLFRVEDLFYLMLPGGEAAPEHSGSSSLMQALSEDLPFTEDRSIVAARKASYSSRIQRRWAGVLDMEPAEGDRALSVLQVSSRPAHHSGHTSRSAISSLLTEIPATAWQGALMVLTGNLLAALAAGDMSIFFSQLKEAVSRGYTKADKILRAWLEYLKKAVLDFPSSGGEALTSMIHEFTDLDFVRQLCEQQAGKACHKIELRDLRVQAKKLLMPFQAPIKELITNAKDFGQDFVRVISRVRKLWSKAREVLEKLIKLAVEVVKKGAEGAVGVLLQASSDDATSDLKNLFRLVFSDMPPLIGTIRELVDRFVGLLRSIWPTITRLQAAGLEVVDLLRARVEHGAKAVQKAFHNRTQSLEQKLGGAVRSKFEEAMSLWGDAQAAGAKAASLAELRASSHMKSRSLLSILTAFATGGGISSPAARIADTFLRDIEHMGHPKSSGFQTEKHSFFEHFGFVTVALTLVTAGLLLSYLSFLCGCIRV